MFRFTVSPASDFYFLNHLANYSIEHVQSLRACAKAGRRLEDSSTGHHHIDTSAFWRDAFRKSEETQNELRARIFELEQTLEAQNGPSSLTPIQATSQKKRKRMASKVGDGDSAIAVKRPRVAGMEQKSQGQDESLPFLVGDVLMPLADPKGEIVGLIMAMLALRNTFSKHFSPSFLPTSTIDGAENPRF